ncbi:MAG: hypothetical protein FJ388_15130, partial [Verrucomicrobia bacterium]|nr:hypothetical protein [Verrucomicrobiota bacterium]
MKLSICTLAALLLTSLAGAQDILLKTDRGAFTGGDVWPLGVGVPLKEGQAKDPGQVGIVSQTRGPLAVQCEARTRYPDGSIQWLWADFLGPVEDSYRLVIAQQKQALSGDDLPATAPHPGPLPADAGRGRSSSPEERSNRLARSVATTTGFPLPSLARGEGQREGSRPGIATASFRFNDAGVQLVSASGKVIVRNGVLQVTWDMQHATPIKIEVASAGGAMRMVAEGRGDGVYVIDNADKRCVLGGPAAEMDFKIETQNKLRAVIRIEGWYVREDGEKV